METNWTTQTPQARQTGLIVEELGNETLVYDETRHRAHCLNSLATMVWKSCDGTRTIGDVFQIASANEAASLESIQATLTQLQGAYLLEGLDEVPAPASNLSRRQILRRAGTAAVAVATTAAIVSITAPAANAAASGSLPGGSSCSADTQCSSGTCMGAPRGVCT